MTKEIKVGQVWKLRAGTGNEAKRFYVTNTGVKQYGNPAVDVIDERNWPFRYEVELFDEWVLDYTIDED